MWKWHSKEKVLAHAQLAGKSPFSKYLGSVFYIIEQAQHGFVTAALNQN